MIKASDLSEHELTTILAYSAYVLVCHELIKGMIIQPIRDFYKNTTFENMPFKSYGEDVRVRHKNEFQACLLYLRDFMKAIDNRDINIIQSLRKHRNDLAHNLHKRLDIKNIDGNVVLMEKAKEVIFKLSNYRAYVEVGQEPELREVNWGTVKGHEFLIIENIIEKVKCLNAK